MYILFSFGLSFIISFVQRFFKKFYIKFLLNIKSFVYRYKSNRMIMFITCKRIIFIKDGRMEQTIENGQSKEENEKRITDIMLSL